VNLLILVTVVASTRMHIYAAHIIVGRTTRRFAYVRIARERAVISRILAGGSRHALGSREATSEVEEARADRV
jgi:hypothetical protein